MSEEQAVPATSTRPVPSIAVTTDAPPPKPTESRQSGAAAPAASEAPPTPGDADGLRDRDGDSSDQARKPRRRRGSRGRGRGPRAEGASDQDETDDVDDSDAGVVDPPRAPQRAEDKPAPAPDAASSRPAPPRIGDTRPAPPAAGGRPQIGDIRPPGSAAAAAVPAAGVSFGGSDDAEPGGTKKRRRRSRGGRGGEASEARGLQSGQQPGGGQGRQSQGGQGAPTGQGGGGRGPKQAQQSKPGGFTVQGGATAEELAAATRSSAIDPHITARQPALGRYLMAVSVGKEATQVAVLEGRTLIQHFVSRPQNDTSEIDGNIYLARVQNVLPGMEAAFIDIGTPKNAVLYRSDVRFDTTEMEGVSRKNRDDVRIEQLLKGGQTIICQVTKNPIAHKGARLTQDVSIPGRFVVLVPNSTTYGISKRLPDTERKRLRKTLDQVKPPQHGLIVRTAAEGASAEELRKDVIRLVAQWEQIEALAASTKVPALLYREPDVAVRIIREEFSKEYRQIVIDDEALFDEVRAYISIYNPDLADRVVLHDTTARPLPLFEEHHVHEQLHKAIDRKVWLKSGGSLIIERTEALTVIDVNTGKNVGSSSLEETVFHNNLEAADEIARQLRLRDIGGIIVIDFVDMEIRDHRTKVLAAFKESLSRDKTRMQVFDISELGLVEMTRKRISEGLVESLSTSCTVCAGRGFTLDQALVR